MRIWTCEKGGRDAALFTPGSCIVFARFLLCRFLLQFFLSILFKAIHRGVHISRCQQKMNKLSGNKSGNQREYTCQSPRSNMDCSPINRHEKESLS